MTRLHTSLNSRTQCIFSLVSVGGTAHGVGHTKQGYYRLPLKPSLHLCEILFHPQRLHSPCGIVCPFQIFFSNIWDNALHSSYYLADSACLLLFKWQGHESVSTKNIMKNRWDKLPLGGQNVLKTLLELRKTSIHQQKQHGICWLYQKYQHMLCFDAGEQHPVLVLLVTSILTSIPCWLCWSSIPCWWPA